MLDSPTQVITLLIAGITLLMDVEAIEVRIGTAGKFDTHSFSPLSVSSLLSLVFLQLSFSQNLPATIDYLTLMDWILDLGYALVMGVVVECIVIRKIYYTLLLQGEGIKEEIQLHNLTRDHSVISDGTAPYIFTPSHPPRSEDVISKLASHKQHKLRLKCAPTHTLRIKRRIRRMEKLLFVIYLGVTAVSLFIISISVKFSSY